MSLYEQFHSDINKKHMYNVIHTFIQKEKGFNILDDPENYQIFLSSVPMVFENNNVDEIEEMNQILLDNNVNFFTEKYEKKTIEPIVKDDFDKLLQEREKQDIASNTSKSSTSENEIQEEKSNETIDMLLETFKTKSNEEVKEVKEVKKNDIETKIIHINSSKRTNINSSRYNYKIDLFKNDISVNEIEKISKLIIPIEDNYLFSIPVLVLIIPELNCNIHMQQEEVLEGNNRKYGVYQSIETHTLINKGNTGRITIDIRDVSEKKYNSCDILKVNIVEFKNNRIYFTCSSIHKLDYQIGDYIKIINNNSHNSLFHIFQEPLKIKKLQENILVCEYRGIDEIDDKILTNIDMKIMNMSNQNIVYFN